MNPMFNEYKDAGKIQEALLIGRNMVNKAPGDSECVNAYLDFLLMLAEKLPRTDERKSFADQANLVLSFYEENADLTDDIINDIHVYHNRLGAVVTDIAQLEQEEYEKQKRAIEATNTTQIKKLYTIKQKLENAKTHAEFDKLLQEISAVDAEIDHDNLTSEQNTHYDQLNKSCTDTISAKMRQLEYKDNIDYNKKAVNAYNSAFTSFKNNESRYKDKSQLFSLVSTTLFAYDAGRLFNETLINLMLTSIKNNKRLSFYQNIAEPRQRKADSLPIAGMISPAMGGMTYSTVTYTNDVNQAFSDLIANVSRRGIQYANNIVVSRGGLMAENFVADSYNLDVTIKRSDAPRATVPEENGRASADIKYGDEQASLKFCKDAESSAMNQTNPGYGDQHRIVPSDQLDDAKDVLTGSAQKNRLRGREDAAAQQEKTRDLLDDRIRGKDGTESTPLTKKQDDDLSKTIKKDENVNAYVDNEAMDKVMEDTGIKGKVKNAISKNEIQGLASAVAIRAGIGFTIGYAVSLAQSGITPDSVKYAFVIGGKSGVASGVQSVVGYGIGRTIGQIATNAIEGVLSNAGLEITANISKMCTMGTVGAITVAVFSTVQFVKLIYHGECLKSAAIQVGKQALFSLSLLAISIAAQGMWGGPAGIIVSIGTGIVIVSYTIADAVHQRTFAEECHIKTIEEYGRLALRHLNELQFA